MCRLYLRAAKPMWLLQHVAVRVNNQINLLSFLSLCLSLPTLSGTRRAPRIPIAALTSRVRALGAAGLRRSLQGSFTRVRGIGLHVRLLAVMVRI